MEQYITSEHVYHGIVSGAKNISRYKDRLNRANQFPVPDHDTGDNLYYLMTKICENLQYHGDMKVVLARTSELAILNSRGNSGTIFSQFFVGFEKHSPRQEKMSLTELVQCFEKGYESAYESIANPVTEGTILSAIKKWSESLREYRNHFPSMESLYEQCLKELKVTVDNSKNILKQQRAQRAHDAGALAFFYFIEGFVSTVVHHTTGVEREDLLEEMKREVLQGEEDNYEAPSSYRFCTEVLVEKKEQAFRKDSLESLGDCLVLSQNERYLKVHIHTNRPDRFHEYLGAYGNIIESKCDDMKIQRIQKKQGKIALVIDSIADIPADFYGQDTYMIPMNLLVNNVSFQDKRTVFPQLLEEKKVSSAQPGNGTLEQVLSKLLVGYEKILILTVSARMSGLYSQYEKLLENFPKDRVHLMDTKLNSVAEGLVVYQAAKMMKEGKELTQIIQTLEQTVSKTRIFVIIKSLKRMIASGRLSHRMGGFLKWIHFLPVITIDKKGQGKMDQFSFSYDKNQGRVVKTLAKKGNKIAYYGVVHCNNPQGAKAFSQKLEKALGFPPLYISDISHVIKIFSGDGSVAVGFTLK